MPAAQGVAAAAPAAATYEPGAASLQLVIAAASAYVPGAQGTHATAPDVE